MMSVFICSSFTSSILFAWVYYHGVKGGGGPSLMDLDLEAHDVNDVYLTVSNRGPLGNDIQHGNGSGFFPINTSNNYIFGTGLWIGGIADIDGDTDPDTVFTQGYNPLAGDSEFQEGRVGQSPSDPLARVFNSLDPIDYLDWPPEFSHYDPEAGDTVPLVYSTQDLATIYNAVESLPVFGIGNLPIEVQQRSMAFIGGGIGQAIYVIFDLENASENTPEGPYAIEDAWIGFDSDMDVGVRFGDDMASVLFQQVNGADTVDLDMGIAWDSDFSESNFTGIPGFVGVALIQSPGDATDGIDNDGDGMIDESPWNGIDDDGDGKTDEPDEVDELGLVSFSKHCSPSIPCEVADPQTDPSGYDLLSCDTPGSDIACLESDAPGDIRFMVSSGPFDWPAGETVRFVMAFVFAEPVGTPTHLDLVGDPPRPDPNDPILANLVDVTRMVREFWSSGISNYQTPLDIVGTTDLEDTNDPFGPYEVITNVVDSVGIHSVTLFYSVDDDPFEEVSMVNQPISLYVGDIPGVALGSTVRYFIQAVDSLFFVARDPETAPLETYGFEIIDAPTFSDITSQSGLPLPQNPKGAVWFDYDLDGNDDLFIASYGEDMLYRNDGNFSFSDVTSEAGIEDIFSDAAQAADFDNDGDLDLYVISFVNPNLLYRNRGDGTFEEIAEAAGVGIETGSQGAVWGDYDRDGNLDLLVFGHNEFTPLLFHNLGDGTFEDKTTEAGVGEVNATTTRAATFFDRDSDGDSDVYLVTFGANVHYDNNGNGTFTDRTSVAGLSDDEDGRDMTLGDYDNDGDLDLLVLSSEANKLFRNNGDGTFQDVAEEAGVSDIGSGYCTFADINLDGYSDLLLSAPVLLINDGNGMFTDRADFAGLDLGGEFIIPADLNGDGFLDLYDSHLYENDGYFTDIGRNWLAVELEGIRSPRDGTGSVVEVLTDGMRQAKVYGEGTGNSMGSLPVEFGLDSAMVVSSLIVHWPSGIVQELNDVTGNQVVRVTEDTTLAGIGRGAGATSASLPRVFSLSQNYPNPFNPSTTIRYDIPGGSVTVPVRLLVYDIRGRLVRKLVDRDREPGRYQVHWDGRDDRGASVSSGVYLYRIEAGEFKSIRKMVLVR